MIRDFPSGYERWEYQVADTARFALGIAVRTDWICSLSVKVVRIFQRFWRGNMCQ